MHRSTGYFIVQRFTSDGAPCVHFFNSFGRDFVGVVLVVLFPFLLQFSFAVVKIAMQRMGHRHIDRRSNFFHSFPMYFLQSGIGRCFAKGQGMTGTKPRLGCFRHGGSDRVLYGRWPMVVGMEGKDVETTENQLLLGWVLSSQSCPPLAPETPPFILG